MENFKMTSELDIAIAEEIQITKEFYKRIKSCHT